MLRKAPHILITTPESLYILLTSPRARELFRTVRTLIVDEIHTLAGSKRGVHLAITLERLQHLAAQPVQRIGLSATIRPLDEAARYLGGNSWQGEGEGASAAPLPRPVTIVDAAYHKQLGPAGGDGGGGLPQPARRLGLAVDHPARQRADRAAPLDADLCQQPAAGRTRRRLAQRGARRRRHRSLQPSRPPPGRWRRQGPRPLWGRRRGQLRPHPRPPRQHEQGGAAGAGGRPQGGQAAGHHRHLVAGTGHRHRRRRPGGAVAGAQGGGAGVAAHRPRRPPGRADLQGALLPHPPRGCDGGGRRGRHGMLAGEVEATHTPRNPLDVLAQQIVAMVSVEPWDVDELYRLLCGAYAYATCPGAPTLPCSPCLPGAIPAWRTANCAPA